MVHDIIAVVAKDMPDAEPYISFLNTPVHINFLRTNRLYDQIACGIGYVGQSKKFRYT